MNTTLDYDDSYTTIVEEPPPPHTAKASAPFMQESPREALTRKITYLMAAEIIADPDFPQKDKLPKTVPPAFNNHGHFLLLDYKLLLLIVWQVIRDIRIAAKNWNFKRRVMQLISFVGAALYALIANQSTVSEAIYFAPLAFVVFYYVGAKILGLKPLAPQIAKIRARALQDLISNKPFVTVHDKVYAEITRRLARVGDGAVDGSKMPVLVTMHGSHPFPDYGKLLGDRIFVCPPKKASKNNLPGVTQMREAVQAFIRGFVKDLGLKHVSFGEALVVHGNSLFIDSPLLSTQPNGEKVPPLWHDKTNGYHLDEHTDKASLRVYFAVQVLFPQHMTLATFFIRPFMAGNAIGYQLAVVALGPPTKNVDDILKMLIKHQLEKSKRKRLTLSEPAEDEEINVLRRIRRRLRAGSPFQNAPIDLAALRKLSIAEREPKDEDDIYDDEIEKLSRECVLWPGLHTALPNWRETHSLAFTKDFFGKAEALAAVATLNDQISKAILDGLDALGYDISDHRDKDGRLVINNNIENLGQIIQGENVNVAQNGKAGESNGAAKTDAGKSASGKAKASKRPPQE